MADEAFPEFRRGQIYGDRKTLARCQVVFFVVDMYPHEIDSSLLMLTTVQTGTQPYELLQCQRLIRTLAAKSLLKMTPHKLYEPLVEEVDPDDDK